MKHVKTITMAKADAWDDISNWFENLWSQIRGLFKGN